MRSLDIAATGMLAQQLYVDVISQNLANINTTSYKQQRPEFLECFGALGRLAIAGLFHPIEKRP